MDKISEEKIEKEAKSQQKFSIAGGIGRAGKGLLKGASPVAEQDQVVKVLQEWVNQNSSDPSGALKSLLKRKISSSSSLIEQHLDRPKDALAGVIEEILSTESMLRDFVRQVDLRWGEMFQKRPFFQKDGHGPHPEDEYTFDSVRAELTRLLGKLKKA
jgi:hypothetical protein